ncbi:MAG: hypothetical protein KAS62_11495, partial [Candidatus Delongbacteria bacterium]|nr:hypothetical protein [Candidatus Delongbacteria bacterium]
KVGSDDFYANLESTTAGMQHISIGRFPASNLAELQNIIDKTISHINSDNLSNINTRVLLVCDDERNTNNDTVNWWETIHILNGESKIVPQIPGNIFTDKLYMTEYPFEYSTTTGLLLKPRAADELIRKLQEGVNLFIYVGHGSPSQLAHEQLLTTSNYSNLSNYNKYYFQIGATCDFGVFNNPYTRSLSEKMLMDRNKGSIGLINAVSSVGINSNELLVRSILSATFQDSLNKLTIGEALKEGKTNYPGANSASYMLIGDPALRFFKDKEVINAPDSVVLKTLILDSLTTTIPDSIGIDVSNGIINTLIIDSEREVKYFNEEEWIPDDDDTLRYTLPGNIILSALSTLSDGQSTTKFILPKDLTYGYDKGKIVYYGYNPDKVEFSGHTPKVSITGGGVDTI